MKLPRRSSDQAAPGTGTGTPGAGAPGVGGTGGVGATSAEPGPDRELLAQRERLTERFAIMQSELGGAFYEMAIRDHLKLDVLMRKAAELQRVDTELAGVERLLASGDAPGGTCTSCGAPYPRGASFCAQCATPVPSA